MAAPICPAGQFFQELRIGLREGVARQFPRENPFEFGAADRLRSAAHPLALEKFQVYCFLAVRVGDFFEQRAGGDFHPQFLSNLADQALLKRFARLPFAAGKFPKAAQMRMGLAARD